MVAVKPPMLPDFLWHGAEAYGPRGEVRTCGRVAQVIEEEFGVRYHKGHVSRLLKALGWTPQVPITRAIQREEEAIERWQRDVWPALRRQARRERRTLAFVDKAGFYLLPGLVNTYAPKGLTPVVYEWQTRDHLSVTGAVTTEPSILTLARGHTRGVCLPLPGAHTIGQTFVEVARAHDGLDAPKPHELSDLVAHTCEGAGETLAV